MGKMIDLTGQRFGKLTVLSIDSTKNKYIYWVCKCSCGNIKSIIGASLKKGHSTSCGCYAIERSKLLNSTHGMAKTRVYKSWQKMHERCENINSDAYYQYGGRGISVCTRWKSFENFLEDMGDRPAEMSLDRINYSGNYEPSNCRWATSTQQNNNMRSNNLCTYNGETYTIAQWAKIMGLPWSTMKARISNMDLDRAFSPVDLRTSSI